MLIFKEFTSHIMKRYLLLFFAVLVVGLTSAQEKGYTLKANISYAPAGADAYRQERCQLDIYVPNGKRDFVTVLWFHGGGLTGGQREIPAYLKEQGIAVIGVGYRLSPHVKVEEIIQDAALAVKWAFQHIEQYGGNPKKIVLSGHSAGGYLNLMLALNKRYLSEVGLDADDLMAAVPFSAQCITHFTARAEQGIDVNQPIVDALAPLYWVRKSPVPMLLITGDRELEMVGRYEENAYLARMLKIVGHPQVKLLELDGYDHGMVYPALPLLVKEISRLEKTK